MRRNESTSRYFYQHASDEQIKFFPAKYLKGVVDQMDHSLFILADKDMHLMDGIDPKKIMARGVAMKPFMDWRHEKEWKGKMSWSIAMYGTPAMAKEAGLSEKEYWNQIIKACFLAEKDPIAKWKQVYHDIEKYRSRLNKLSPKIDRLHAVGKDMDLWVKLGENARGAPVRGRIFRALKYSLARIGVVPTAGYASINRFIATDPRSPVLNWNSRMVLL